MRKLIWKKNVNDKTITWEKNSFLTKLRWSATRQFSTSWVHNVFLHTINTLFPPLAYLTCRWKCVKISERQNKLSGVNPTDFSPSRKTEKDRNSCWWMKKCDRARCKFIVPRECEIEQWIEQVVELPLFPCDTLKGRTATEASFGGELWTSQPHTTKDVG